MSVPTIAVFVGSLRKDSCNRKLAHALEKLAGDRARFQYVQIGDLPLYDQDFDADYPPQGTRLKDQVRAADAVLFVTPEYNRSVPTCSRTPSISDRARTVTVRLPASRRR